VMVKELRPETGAFKITSLWAVRLRARLAVHVRGASRVILPACIRLRQLLVREVTLK